MSTRTSETQRQRIRDMAGSPLSKAITCTHDKQSACHPQCERGSFDGTLSPEAGFLHRSCAAPFLAACCKQKLGMFPPGGPRPPFGHDKLTRMPAASNNSWFMSISVLAGRLLWFLLALHLFGCASSPAAGQSPRAHGLADNVPTRAGGEPANAPQRPNAPPAYPSVFEVKEVRRAK